MSSRQDASQRPCAPDSTQSASGAQFVLAYKLESHQYNVALAIIGKIKGTPKERLYQKLSLETLCSRR